MVEEAEVSGETHRPVASQWFHQFNFLW
jgi:hypothetical protein